MLFTNISQKWKSWNYYFNNSNNKNCSSSNNHDCWNCYFRKNRKVKLEIFHSYQSSSLSQYWNSSMMSSITLTLRHISDGFRTSSRKNVQSYQMRKKISVLLRKLGTVEHQKYCNYILHCWLSETSFEGTVKISTTTFGGGAIFHTRYQVLNLAKNMKNDFSIYTGIVNQECERCKLKTLTEDQFKCLIFVLVS